MIAWFQEFKLNSIRKNLLFWIIIFLLPVLLVITLRSYFSIQYFTNLTNNRSLFRVALAVASAVSIEGDKLEVNSTQNIINLMQYEGYDEIHFGLFDQNRKWINGDKEITLPKNLPLSGRYTYFDTVFDKKPLRMVVFNYPLNNENYTFNVLIAVGETMHQRNSMNEDIVHFFLITQLLITILIIFAVNIAIKRGLISLEILKNLIESRHPEDTKKLEKNSVTKELQPIVTAMNDLLVRVQASVDEKKKFIENAAHQLKTPLAGLKLQVEDALKGDDLNYVRHALNLASQSARHLTRLTNQLLSLARAEFSNIDNTTKSPSFSTIDLVELIQEITAEWVPIAFDKNIDLGIQSEFTALTIQGNKLLLTELLNNLINNAIHYNPAETKITVKLEKTNNRPTLIVEDNGIGIPLQEQELVFQRFYRILGRNEIGCGLGLSIVKEIAFHHRANIVLTYADHQKKMGTVVKVFF